MTLLVLVILALMWAAVLLPPLIRSRTESRPGDSISSFRRQLSVLERTSPSAGSNVTDLATRRRAATPASQPVDVPAAGITLHQAQQRRRTILFGLGASTLLVVALAVVGGGILLWAAAAGMVGLVLAYTALLVRARQVSMERAVKVRYLPTSVGSQPALLLRRSGS
ncbi:MAG: hypothetical protein IPM45_13075 [Acidimicrobiales bacterium]|nr:hypothetical protein [Acidimicrobiales bacterium]